MSGEDKGKIRIENQNRLDINNLVGKNPEFCYVLHEMKNVTHYIREHERIW